MTETTSYFTPQWVSPPGDTIQNVIEERDWILAQLSKALGYSPQFINQLLNGEAIITAWFKMGYFWVTVHDKISHHSDDDLDLTMVAMAVMF